MQTSEEGEEEEEEGARKALSKKPWD